MSGSTTPAPVIPAQLSFLAIYNPSLGSTEETLGDQIVFYSSASTRARKSQRNPNADDTEKLQEEENEKLRQIGLAQGMVDFAKNFSDGKPVDFIETEKSRIVLHELEQGWWIVASIDLTRLPLSRPSPVPKFKQSSETPSSTEYSAREVSSPELILQQLLLAHRIFLLHHAESLSDLWTRISREKFCTILERFWTRFIWNWDILLHGNPATDLFSGVKLAAGGELGVGVGEEEWGSGEREVLEGLVTQTEGLIDLVVSRFGGDEPLRPDSQNQPEHSKERPPASDGHQWLGLDMYPRPGDGVIFSGTGAISRRSSSSITRWMEWIYRYGEDAYGVKDDPNSTHRRKRRKIKNSDANSISEEERGESNKARDAPNRSRDRSPGIPPPIAFAAEQSLHQATKAVSSRSSSNSRLPMKSDDEGPGDQSLFGTDTMIKYLTLGYGSSWGLSYAKPSHRRVSALRQGQPSSTGSVKDHQPEELQTIDPTPEISDAEEEVAREPQYTTGRYVIGPKGKFEQDVSNDKERESSGQNPMNNDLMLRTLHVEMPQSAVSTADDKDPPQSVFKKVQVVVYLRQPFMYTFLFELGTPSLSLPPFYHSLHRQLGPLQKPLLSSTSLTRAQGRMFASVATRSTSAYPDLPIYDLVYDPQRLTVHSSIPNIPEPGSLAADALVTGMAWNRIEALNVHSQILNTYSNTRGRYSLFNETERTCKTSRGWWVVWMRLPHSSENADSKDDLGLIQGSDTPSQEAFLVRRASDYISSSMSYGKKAGGGSKWLRDISGSSTASTAVGGNVGSPGKVAEGIGIDARKYVEGLLRLNR